MFHVSINGNKKVLYIKTGMQAGPGEG